MSRSPVYHSDNRRYRIISVPGGLWQPQRLSDAKGSNTFDPWINIGRNPVSQAEAVGLMNGAVEGEKGAK